MVGPALPPAPPAHTTSRTRSTALLRLSFAPFRITSVSFVINACEPPRCGARRRLASRRVEGSSWRCTSRRSPSTARAITWTYTSRTYVDTRESSVGATQRRRRVTRSYYRLSTETWRRFERRRCTQPSCRRAREDTRRRRRRRRRRNNAPKSLRLPPRRVGVEVVEGSVRVRCRLPCRWAPAPAGGAPPAAPAGLLAGEGATLGLRPRPGRRPRLEV